MGARKKDPPKSTHSIPYARWGSEIDPSALLQMENACRLPIAVKAALMPDAHVGYGLPIGGVLATEGAVIPYAVGVDIACRVKLSVFSIPPERLQSDPDEFVAALEFNTKFGIGAKYKERKSHAVMDSDWSFCDTVRRVKDTAWSQLGTSGSGNHFIEFGEITFADNPFGIAPGEYVGLVSHSGSRGSGSTIAKHYSSLAMKRRHGLSQSLKHLAWLDLDGDGAEYWRAMELMGAYASANHEIIHQDIARHFGEQPIVQVENHHNFAWKERHSGKEVVVHRKGATPAAAGQIGYVPGSMTAPGFLVEGRGDPDSLYSCSHGAGRQMSRKQARKQFSTKDLKRAVKEHEVRLVSAGVDEIPFVYKDINRVMAEQKDLVRPLARFTPRIVKMAPGHEPAED